MSTNHKFTLKLNKPKIIVIDNSNNNSINNSNNSNNNSINNSNNNSINNSNNNSNNIYDIIIYNKTHKPYIGFSSSKDTLVHLMNNTPNGVSAFQICMTPTNSFMKGKEFSSSETLLINQLKLKRDIYIVVHGKYVYNFCRNISRGKDELYNELYLANTIGSDVIIHQGSNVEKLPLETAIDNYTNVLKEVLQNTNKNGINNKIILENSAREGTDIGYDLETLTKIYNKFSDEEKNRIGFCIDLCHIFVSGELDVRNPNDVKKFFLDFHNNIGIYKIVVIHFNDSNIQFNGRVDRHADIGHGFITNGGTLMDGFIEVKKIATGFKIPMILETNCKHENMASQIARMNSI